MKKEELQNYPKLAPAELEEALETAVSRTRFPMPSIGNGFKHFFSQLRATNIGIARIVFNVRRIVHLAAWNPSLNQCDF